jgi:hypothetical protein
MAQAAVAGQTDYRLLNPVRLNTAA